MVKVSVIVPIYNSESYLEKCLNSLINQTLQDIEIICVNDGSTDNSLNILTEYANKDSRIKIINHLPLPPHLLQHIPCNEICLYLYFVYF